jgi:hypothetical protein
MSSDGIKKVILKGGDPGSSGPVRSHSVSLGRPGGLSARMASLRSSPVDAAVPRNPYWLDQGSYGACRADRCHHAPATGS